jgi:hypothetical protein
MNGFFLFEAFGFPARRETHRAFAGNNVHRDIVLFPA